MSRNIKSLLNSNVWRALYSGKNYRYELKGVEGPKSYVTYSFRRNFHCRLLNMGSIVSCRNSSSETNQETITSTGSQREMSSNASEDFEATVCEVSDIPENGMKTYEVEGGKILIANSNGEISAVGAKCTHYGAPLEKGNLCNGTVRCPFHGACFSLKTGDIEDFPGLDSIPKYNVQIQEGKVIVSGKRGMLQSHKRIKNLSKRDPDDNRTFIVCGGGGAGAKCVETLRQEGFTGRLILISNESTLPYDRPKLSKFMHQNAESIALRGPEFYEEGNIELELGNSVSSLDSESKKVTLSNGKELTFDKIVLATGGQPRKLTIPGSDLDGVFVLRNPLEANKIVERSHGKNVVIIGSSFIGMEAAAYLASENRTASVTVVGSSSVPFERSLGSVIGSRIQNWFEEKGIKFQNSTNVTELRGKEVLEKVILQNGEELEADVVVAGIGVDPSTDYLLNSGVVLNDRNYVQVNEEMETNVEGIYCAGDIAHFPLFLNNNERVSIGHWQMAHTHGHIAALNMVGKKTPIKSVPFFWTMLFGKSFRYAGYGSFDSVIVHGDLEAFSFLAYYCQGDKVVALASVGKDPAAAKYADYLLHDSYLTKEQVLEDGDIVMKL